MHRPIISAVLILFLFLNFAMAGEIEVLETDIERQETILLNSDTGEQRVYEIGDKIQGWRISEIKATSISLSQPPIRKGDPVLMKIVPLQASRYVIQTVHRPDE
jgi:hypothetical protein